MSIVRKMLSFLELKDNNKTISQNPNYKTINEQSTASSMTSNTQKNNLRDDYLYCISHNLPMNLHFDNTNEIVPKSIYSLYNGTMRKRKTEIIARDILSTVGVCSSQNPLCKEAFKYVSQNHSRIETCIYGAEICIPPKNNNELYLIYSGYSFAGASARNEAIFWCEKYIENGAVSDYIQSQIIHTNTYSYEQKIKFVALTYSHLGKLYAEENRFVDSNKKYLDSIAIAPFLSSSYTHIAKNYISMNNFDKAIETLEEATKSIFYTIDESFKYGIDNSLTKINKQVSEQKYYKSVVIPSILKAIIENPGIIQKDLYTYFPNLEAKYLRWTFQFLEKEGKICRQKKGNSYSLFINNN